MRDFFKYLFWGCLGLVLSLSLPQFPVDWAAIVLTQAFLNGEKKISAWLLIPALAFIYSAFSLAAPWTLILPSAVGALLWFALRRNFSFPPFFSRLCLLLAMGISPILFWALAAGLRGHGWYLGWEEGLSLAATLAFGLALLPALGEILAGLRRRFLFFSGAARRVDLTRADWIRGRGARILRKPFGLEKGL